MIPESTRWNKFEPVEDDHQMKYSEDMIKKYVDHTYQVRFVDLEGEANRFWLKQKIGLWKKQTKSESIYQIA